MSSNQYHHTTEAFLATIVEKIGEYPYPISPFSGVTMPIKPELLAEAAEAAKNEKLFTDVDLIITFESTGTQLAAIVGQALNLPYLIARKKRFNLPNEITFEVTTNFDEKNFYLYGEVTGKKILIIDDVVASGETIKSAVIALQSAGAYVKALFVIAAKSNSIGKRYQTTLSEIDVSLISLVKIKIRENKVVVL